MTTPTTTPPTAPGTHLAPTGESINPFGEKTERTAAVEIETERAIAETQGAIVIAQRFPRDQQRAMDRILVACTRPTLAEKATYQYARGDADIKGASIRLAEAIAQNWGNIQWGVRELEQKNGASTVEAYCWDVETNSRSSKQFTVPHIRFTRKGQVRLEDSRDIYELVANQGARRVRSCILAVIPGDVVEAAVEQAEKTLTARVRITPELIKQLVDTFESLGVPKRALEKKLQRRAEAITPALVVMLRRIFNSLKDGMSGVADHFDLTDDEAKVANAVEQSRIDSLADRLAQQQGNGGTTPPDETPPEPPKPRRRRAADAAPPETPTEAAGAPPEPPVEQTPAAPPEAPPAPTPASTAPAIDDDAQRDQARHYRTEIVRLWKNKPMGAALGRLYAKGTLLDLTLPQLEMFYHDSPRLLGLESPSE